MHHHVPMTNRGVQAWGRPWCAPEEGSGIVWWKCGVHTTGPTRGEQLCQQLQGGVQLAGVLWLMQRFSIRKGKVCALVFGCELFMGVKGKGVKASQAWVPVFHTDL